MGCSSPQNATIPHNIPAGHYNRLMQVSDINHQLNVNKKYQHISKVRLDQQVGQGIKKTYAYDCITTEKELQNKRKEFWETRVNGAPQCWNALHMVVDEPDQSTGKAILQSVRLSMLNGNIQMNVDSRGNKYEVPIFCINSPLSFSGETMAEKNLNLEFEDTPVKIRIRSVAFPDNDLHVEMKMSSTVEEVKKALREGRNITDQKGIRFFYAGRQIADEKALGNYNYKEGTVIQAMIR